MRNSVTVLDRTGQPERATAIIGWLGEHSAGIPGTPGMRARVEHVRKALECRHGRQALAPLLEEGARLTVREVVGEAEAALAVERRP